MKKLLPLAVAFLLLPFSAFAWTTKTGATGASTPVVTSFAVANGSALNVGDTLCVSATFDLTSGAVTSAVLTDDLGNTYTSPSGGLAKDGANQGLQLFCSIITHAGTPTVTVKFNPTPGTTASGGVSLNLDPFSGSDSNSAIDGTGAKQSQGAPGTGTDGVTSGSFTTTNDGDLIYTATVDSASGNNPGSVGTGFSLLHTSAFVVLKSAWKTQTTHGSVAGTWTAAVNETHLTVAIAVKPATITNTFPKLMSTFGRLLLLGGRLIIR